MSDFELLAVPEHFHRERRWPAPLLVVPLPVRELLVSASLSDARGRLGCAVTRAIQLWQERGQSMTSRPTPRFVTQYLGLRRVAHGFGLQPTGFPVFSA